MDSEELYPPNDKSTQFPSPPPPQTTDPPTPIMVDVSLSKLREEKLMKERNEDWSNRFKITLPQPLEDDDDEEDDDVIFCPQDNPWYPDQKKEDFMWGSHTAQWNPDLNCAICGRLVSSMSPGLRTWASQYDPWGKRYTTGTLCSPICRVKYLNTEMCDLEAYDQKMLNFMGSHK